MENNNLYKLFKLIIKTNYNNFINHKDIKYNKNIFTKVQWGEQWIEYQY